MKYSMYKTFARKYKTNVHEIKRRYCKNDLFTLAYETKGGKKKTTLKEMSELLGKETIDLYNTSENRGWEKTYGLNYQKSGKDMS